MQSSGPAGFTFTAHFECSHSALTNTVLHLGKSVRTNLIPYSCFGKVSPFLRCKVTHWSQNNDLFQSSLVQQSWKFFLVNVWFIWTAKYNSRFIGAHRREQGAELRFLFLFLKGLLKELSPLLACTQCFTTLLHPVVPTLWVFHLTVSSLHSKAWSWPRTSLWMLQSGLRFRAQTPGPAELGVTMPIRDLAQQHLLEIPCVTKQIHCSGATLTPAEGAPEAWGLQAGFGHLTHCSLPTAAWAQLCQSLSLQENQYYFQLCASN